MPVIEQFNPHAAQNDVQIILPDYIDILYEDLCALKINQGRSCEGALIYGGAMLSYAKNQVPRDIDMFVCAPELIDELQSLHIEQTKPYGSYRNLEDSITDNRAPSLGSILKPSKNLNFAEERLSPPSFSETTGKAFQVIAYFQTSKVFVPVDITFIEKPITPIELSSLLRQRFGDDPERQIIYDLKNNELLKPNYPKQKLNPSTNYSVSNGAADLGRGDTLHPWESGPSEK